MDGFDHEKLDVYHAAVEFADLADTVAGRGDLVDQLRRASASICLNIAEGSGEYSPREKARFYRIARRSATECAAILELCQRRELRIGQPGDSLKAGRDLLLRLVRMLVRMIQATESRVS